MTDGTTEVPDFRVRFDDGLPIGAKNVYGTVVAVLWCGERYYFMLDEDGTVSLLPASSLTTQSVTDEEKRLRLKS